MTRWSVAIIGTVVSYVVAQSTNAPCKNNSDTIWSYNSLGQTPCLMAAYIQGACQPDGKWVVQALPDVSFRYNGPDSSAANECTCSSIAYALSSACGFCQGAGWPEWSQWTANCGASDVHNGSYPHPIPAGTAIPDWAFVPIDGFLDTFDAVDSEDIGDKFESTGTFQPTGTGQSPSTGGVSATSTNTGSGTAKSTQGIATNPGGATSSTSVTGTSIDAGPGMPTGSSGSNTQTHSTNIAGVVGGVIGGLAGAAVIGGLVVYFCVLPGRHNQISRTGATGMRPRASTLPMASSGVVLPPSAPSTPGLPTDLETTVMKEVSPADFVESLPFVSSEPLAPTMIPDMPPMRLYDPKNPTTFPPTPPPLTMPNHPQMNTALGTYPNIGAETYTHEETDQLINAIPNARRPVPEL